MAMAAAGCAGADARSVNVAWTKPGVDAEGARLEYGLCGGNFDRFGAPRFRPSEFAAIDACMNAKGFARIEE
jgi:hypothetical protein